MNQPQQKAPTLPAQPKQQGARPGAPGNRPAGQLRSQGGGGNGAPRQGTLVQRQKRSNEAMLVENSDSVRQMYVQMEGRSNVAFVWHSIMIRTDAGRRLLEDGFDVISRSSFILNVIAQSSLVRLPVMMKALEGRLVTLIEDIYSKMSDEAKKIAAECEEVGVDLPHYHGASRVDVQIVTPKVLKLVQVIECYDEMMARNDAIWFGGSGKRTDVDRVRYIRTWRNVLKRVFRTFALINQQIGRLMKRVSNGEEIDASSDEQLKSVDFLIDMVGTEDAMLRAIEGKRPRKKPTKKQKVREVSVEEHMATRQKSLGESNVDAIAGA